MRLVWGHRRLVAAVVAIAVIVVAVYTLAFKQDKTHITVYFNRATGLYSGDEVKVLGVTVGKVDSIKADKSMVRVDLSIDSDQKIPAQAKAALVSPSLVAGRFVQLAPAYSGGAAMGDGGVIPASRTAVPVEFDTVKKQLTQLASALGPNAQNKKGALNDLVNTVSANLGNGTAADLRTSITNLSAAARTINTGSGDLFTTLSNLQSFVGNLVQNQNAVESFSKRLTSVSGLLADNSDELSLTLKTLQQSLGEITTFLNSNKAVVGDSVAKLSTLTTTLKDRKMTVANLLENVPNLAANAINIIDPAYAAIMGRLTVNNLNSISQLVCGAVLGVGGTSAQCQSIVTSLMSSLGVSQTLPGTPGNPLATTPLTTSPAPTAGAGQATAPLDSTLSAVGGAVQGTVGSLLGLLVPSTGAGR